MFATGTTQRRPFLHGLERLKTFGFISAFRPKRAHVVQEAEADLRRMSLQTLDELGLLSGEGCVTDWGLLERAARLRSGWS